MGEEIEGIEAKIQELAGDPFNPASPKQLADVLFNKLGLPVKKKTPGNAFDGRRSSH